MAKTVLELTPIELRKYSFKPKRPKSVAHQKRLMARAMRQARRAADLLKRDFGATRVVLFGSLAHRLWFSERSDIDLAVWGIPPKDFYRAAAAVTHAPADFEMNIVDPVHVLPSLRNTVEEEGIAL